MDKHYGKQTKYTKKYPNFNTKGRYKSCLLLRIKIFEEFTKKSTLNPINNFI